MGKNDDKILTRYQMMTQKEECDPILVQAKVTLVPYLDASSNKMTYKKKTASTK